MKKIYVFIITILISSIPFILRILKLYKVKYFGDVSISLNWLFIGASAIRFFMCWVTFIIWMVFFKEK